MRRKESLKDDPEVKNTVTVNTVQVKDDSEPMSKLINYFSEWQKLKRAVSWILKLKGTMWQLKEERKVLTTTLNHTEKDPAKE